MSNYLEVRALIEMKYRGRIVHTGELESNEPFFGYTAEGRSPASQARKFVIGPNTSAVYVEPVTADATLVKMFPGVDLEKLKKDIAKGVAENGPLIFYPAMIPRFDSRGRLTDVAASNGAQTDLIFNGLMRRERRFYPEEILEEAVRFPHYVSVSGSDKRINLTSYEPDEPNFTARVNLAWSRDTDPALSIVRHEKGQRVAPEPYRVRLEPGLIHSLPTYHGYNEAPLRPFRESEPLKGMIDAKTAEDVCELLFEVISRPNPHDGNKVYGVAAAVMVARKDGSLETAIINRADRC